jgi:biotin carboxylase
MQKKILFIAGAVGPKFDYVLPKIKRYGQLYSYISTKLNNERADVLTQHSQEVIEGNFFTEGTHNEKVLVDDIVLVAKRIKADSIIALDEFSIAPTSLAAATLGLRGAGSNIHISRNKYMMRQAFQSNDVPCPKYYLIDNVGALKKVCQILKFPFLLKVTEGAGSLANVVVNNAEHAESVYTSLCKFVIDLGEHSKFGMVDSFLKPEFIAEEIIDASTDSWYNNQNYADYLSVEGFVIDGKYQSISITSRMPTIPPFIETAIQTPCVLEPALQKKIANMAAKAVDALGLSYCATHTEIKLKANQQLCLIESAARVPGASIVKITEDSFGIDFVSMLTELLLTGHIEQLPDDLLLDYKKASGAVAILPTNVKGQPWTTTPLFTKNINWRAILPSEINFEVDWGPTLKEGEPIPKYDITKGLLNYLGGVLMTCNNPDTLIKAQHDILNFGEALFSKQI